MNQSKFRYALYHSEDQSVEDVLESLDGIKDFNVLVSITATGCRGKEPIDDRRTTVEINTDKQTSFNDLDEQLKESFTDIWFEH